MASLKIIQYNCSEKNISYKFIQGVVRFVSWFIYSNMTRLTEKANIITHNLISILAAVPADDDIACLGKFQFTSSGLAA